MVKCHIIDTFPTFLTFWAKARQKPLEAQIEDWASDYMSGWPELLEKQREDYASQKVDWRQIAQERISPFLGDRLPTMREAHQILLESCQPIYSQARKALGFESEAFFVIYVGIGCGAGWVTTYQNSPAILFGLENIAEEGWSQPATLTGLVAHELGHLAHFHWLAQHELPTGSGPWWQLFTEGFAQRCEHLILGEDTWHMNDSSSDDTWLEWCQDHKGWLAAEFLRVVEVGESVRPFFGSWFDVRGRKQTGYFLGHELIKELEASISLKEIALLDNVEGRLRRILEMVAGRSG